MRLLAAGVAAVALAGTAAAQPAVRQTTTTSTTEVRKASVVMNANVAVDGGATVGKITDFVISDGGCIEYVVIDSESKYVLVPYQVIRVEGDRHVVTVNVTREKWRDLPTFTGTNWPVRDEAYLSKVRTTFGVRESGYGRDGRDGDRRPLDRTDNRGDNRGDRRDQPSDRPQQRRDVENPTRPGTTPPATRPDTTRPDPNRTPPDVNRDRDTNRTSPDRSRTPPPPPPGTDRPQPPDRDRPPV